MTARDERVRRLEYELEREQRNHERHVARLEHEHAARGVQLDALLKHVATAEMLRPPAPIVMNTTGWHKQLEAQVAHLESVLRDALDSGTIKAGSRETALAAFAVRYVKEFGYALKVSPLGKLAIAARDALATGLPPETAREEYESQPEDAREFRYYDVSAFGADGHELAYEGYRRTRVQFEVLLDGTVRGDIGFPPPMTIGRGAEVTTIGLHDLTGRLVACGPMSTLYLAFGQRASARVTVRL